MKMTVSVLHLAVLLALASACMPSSSPAPTGTTGTLPAATAGPMAVATTAPTATAMPAPTRTDQPPAAAPTPLPTAIPPAACQPPLPLTPAQIEGPMYLADPPQRSNFRGDAANAGGQPIVLTGRVLTPDCEPIANARVDVWHTDAKGRYDMTKAYTSRGYMLTDSEGRYQFETILPGIYTGRTAHIHVKVTPPGGQTLTTQLYFPNAATNVGDAIFDSRLLVKLDETPQGLRASFDFVVRP